MVFVAHRGVGSFVEIVPEGIDIQAVSVWEPYKKQREL
jgi:hypothetical protein